MRSGASFPALTNRVTPKPTVPQGPSYSDVAAYGSQKTSQVKGLSNYMEMILDPHRSTENAVRYPDETIVPTGLVSLQDSITYTVPAEEVGTVGTFRTLLRWKVIDDDVASSYSENPILSPIPIGATSHTGGTRTYTQQSNWLPLSAVDRTLACGIRLRMVGLPTSTFMPSGTVYFLQYQNVELSDFNAGLITDGESYARAAVAAKKGFSCTINELSKTEGVTVPYLPQGPMSFVFSDSNTAASAIAGIVGAGVSSTVVSANGGVMVVGFGLQPGSILRFDYGHVIEYVPRAKAAGLIQTAVQPPSSAMRDSISHGAAMVQQTISGATSLSSIAKVVAGGAMQAAAAVAKSVVASVPGGSAVVRGLAGMAEGLGAPSWLKSALNALA